MPAVPEAMGLARATQLIPQPYFISFVIDREGYVLDGTKLSDAIEMVDRYSCDRSPLGYWINCGYPSFLVPAVMTSDVRQRLVGYQANASSKSHTDLDGCDAVCQDDINDWVARMASLYHRWGLKIMGGGCGTGLKHLRHLVDALSLK